MTDAERIQELERKLKEQREFSRYLLGQKDYWVRQYMGYASALRRVARERDEALGAYGSGKIPK